MAGALQLATELNRRGRNRDDNFYRRFLYFFELIVPESVAVNATTSYLYPLIIPPTSYKMDEIFSVEDTPTQGGGLYVEENGIIQRQISLVGNTGFKPRDIRLRGMSKSSTLPPDKASFDRELPDVIYGAISGQRHFQYLQDTVFRTYADLKRNPATAKETGLIFHNPKDEEHWLVIPRNFALERDAASPTIYNYSIELLVVDKAERTSFKFSEDQGIFDWIKDKVRALKKGVDFVNGALTDLNALTGEIKSYINNISVIIDGVTDIVNATTDFVNGTTEYIQQPFTSIESSISDLEAALFSVNTTMEIDTSGRNFPENTKQKLHQVVDGLEVFGRYPELFETPQEEAIRAIRTRQENRRAISNERKEEAETFGSPTTFDEVRNLGTQLTAGDAEAIDGEVLVGGSINRYKSAREVTIESGESLSSLAARYMGDARLWQYIAVLNGLKAPFVDSQADAPLVASVRTGSSTTGAATGADESPFGDTLGVGSKILIPTNTESTLQKTILPVSGARLEEPVESRFLGTDFALEAVGDPFGSSRAQYDIPIDTAGGSVDGKLVSGLTNMIQAVTMIVLTEQGTDPLYKRVGTQDVVGLNATEFDLELIRFRIREAILADPRVAAVRNLTMISENDVLTIDLDAHLHGFSESQPIRISL